MAFVVFLAGAAKAEPASTHDTKSARIFLIKKISLFIFQIDTNAADTEGTKSVVGQHKKYRRH